MKAFILAAGLGTRLKPFTLHHPKALVPVGGVPMLERVLLRLKDEGFAEIVVNVHHFADQIEDFLKSNQDFGLNISISDEREELLDTGGAILKARSFLDSDREPFLVHNVDILSNAPLQKLMERHQQSGCMATLLVSDRDSSRRLCFDSSCDLRGWLNLKDNSVKPEGFVLSDKCTPLAFSGIHVMSPDKAFAEMRRQERAGAFSVIEFYLDAIRNERVKGFRVNDLRLIDIGKPETLARADVEYS